MRFCLAFTLVVTIAGCAAPRPVSTAEQVTPRSGPIIGCVNDAAVRNPAIPIREATIIRNLETCPEGMREVPQNEYFAFAVEAERIRRPTTLSPGSITGFEPPRSNRVVVNDDEFNVTINFVGEATRIGATDRIDGVTYRLISSRMRRTGAVLHQIFFSDNYYDRRWRFYDRASDDRANRLDFTYDVREVVSCDDPPYCIYREVGGARVSEAALTEAVRRGGYRVRFSGASYEQVVEISPASIEAQFRAIAAYRSGR